MVITGIMSLSSEMEYKTSSSSSSFKLTRKVYENMMHHYGIMPNILHEWITNCADPEAVRTYLMFRWGDGYFGVDDETELLLENRERLYHMGRHIFDNRYKFKNPVDYKRVKDILSYMSYGHSGISPQQVLANNAEFDAWCKTMDIQ